MDIGSRITQLRKAKGISTNKLANLAGVSQSYLREVEMGKKNPTVETLSYICFGLDTTITAFFSCDKENILPALLSAIENLSHSEQLKLAEFINAMKKSD